VRASCNSMISQYGSGLAQALENHMQNVTKICQFAGACSGPPKRTSSFYGQIGHNAHHDLRSKFKATTSAPGRWHETFNYDWAEMGEYIVLGTVSGHLISYSITDKDYLLAFSLTKNTTMWKMRPPKISGGLLYPALSPDGSVVYVFGGGYLSAINAITGKQIWQNYADSAHKIIVSPQDGRIFVANNKPWTVVSFFPNGTRENHLVLSKYCQPRAYIASLGSLDMVISYAGTELLVSGMCSPYVGHYMSVVNIDISGTPKISSGTKVDSDNDNFSTGNAVFSMVTPSGTFVHISGTHIMALDFTPAAGATGGTIKSKWTLKCTNQNSYCISNIEGPAGTCYDSACTKLWAPNPNYDWLKSSYNKALLLIDVATGHSSEMVGAAIGQLPPQSSIVVDAENTVLFQQNGLNGPSDLYAFKSDGVQVAHFPAHDDTNQVILLDDLTVLVVGKENYKTFCRKYQFN